MTFRRKTSSDPGIPLLQPDCNLSSRIRQTGQPGLEPGIAGFGDRCLSQLGHCPRWRRIVSRVPIAVRGAGRDSCSPPQPSAESCAPHRAKVAPARGVRARRGLSPAPKTPNLNLGWLRMSDRSERIWACLSSAIMVALAIVSRGSKARGCGRGLQGLNLDHNQRGMK